MKKQLIKLITQWCTAVAAITIYFAGTGMLQAQNANKEGFQAASNKGIGYVFKEHSDGSWRGNHTAKLKGDAANLIIAAEGDIIFKRLQNGAETSTTMRLNTAGSLEGLNSIAASSITSTSIAATTSVSTNTITATSIEANSADISVLSADGINIKQHAKSNLGLGYGTGIGLNTGYQNTNVGSRAGGSMTSASNNSNFGADAGGDNLTGNSNSNFGNEAGKSNTTGNGNNNFGVAAGKDNTTGNYNSNFGIEAGRDNTIGSFNSNFGVSSGWANSTGISNSNFGVEAGRENTAGGFNSNFGRDAGRLNKTGYRNSNFGANAGRSIKGAGNTSMGAYAGKDLTNVNYSVFLGYSAGADFSHVTFEDNQNPIANGKSVFVVNNQAQLHNPLLFGTFVDNQNHDDPSSRTEAGSMAQLAINTHHLVDSCALTVAGGVHIGPKDVNPAHFAEDTLFNNFLLWVERGIVTEDLAIAKVEEWSDHVFGEDYTLAGLEEVERYIRKHGHLPNIPSEAEVRKSGYSLQKITARFLEKIEELTLHAIEQEKQIKKLKEVQSIQLQALADKISAIEEVINK